MDNLWFAHLVDEAKVQGNIFLRGERNGVLMQPQHLASALLDLADGAERVYYDKPDLRKPCGRIRKFAQDCRDELLSLAGSTIGSEKSTLLYAAIERRLSLIDFQSGKVVLP